MSADSNLFMERFKQIYPDTASFMKAVTAVLENGSVSSRRIAEKFIERGGGKNTETLKDLCSLLGFLHKCGSRICEKTKCFLLPSHSRIAPNRFRTLAQKYDIKDSAGNDRRVITLIRLASAFPLQNLRVAMKIKPRSYLKDVDFTLPHHWLSIDGAASLIPRNSKYDPLAKIFVYYQNHIRHILEITGAKKLRNYDPKESCKLARQGAVPEKIRIKGLILAGIIDPTTEDIVEQVQAFANTFDVVVTEI